MRKEEMREKSMSTSRTVAESQAARHSCLLTVAHSIMAAVNPSGLKREPENRLFSDEQHPALADKRPNLPSLPLPGVFPSSLVIAYH